MNVATFSSTRFGELRTQQASDGKIWFCLADVCKALDLQQVSRVKQRLKRDGVTTIKGVSQTTNQHGVTTEQAVQLNFIDEPNLYRCIFQSRKEEAELFQDWVCGEVLPSIRKTGGYITATVDETPEEILAKALVVAKETLNRQKQKLQILSGENEIYKEEIKTLAPKAEYVDDVLQSTSTFTTTQIAKDLGMSAITLNKKLKELGIQYYQSGQWMLYSKYQDKGLTDVRVMKFVRHDDSIGTNQSMVWTEKGRKFIHELQKGGQL